eukprot:TRINITY_DN621_c0_g1_i1.p1 TRINITY_DN621_c0_g1~~TRINITY_DN621_c0_g1_i1.p1  ORF type:complete len:111 (-),score=4.10 TRINITY_DN621_c0_g1_i1:25-357(-)
MESDDISFRPEEAQAIAAETVGVILGTHSYSHSKVQHWVASIIEQTMKRLVAMNKPYKYILSCVIMQKNGAGLHTASSCYWDNSSDGSNNTYKFENKSMYCILTMFALAL